MARSWPKVEQCLGESEFVGGNVPAKQDDATPVVLQRGLAGDERLIHSLVSPFAWHEVSDSATRLAHISAPTGNEVEVAVENGLARDITDIQTNVETLNSGILSYEPFPGGDQQLMAGQYLFLGKGKVIHRMSPGYD